MTTFTDTEKQRLRNLRFTWGMVCACVWVAGCYFYFSAHLYAWVATFAMVPVMITAPFGFIIGHFIARSIVEREQREAIARIEANAAAKERSETEAKQQRQAEIEKNHLMERLKNSRNEIIKKLDSTLEFLDVLPRTTESDRVEIAKQGAIRSLQEIVAKFPLPELTTLITSDEVIQLKVDAIQEKLSAQDVYSVDAQVLRKARAQPIATHA